MQWRDYRPCVYENYCAFSETREKPQGQHPPNPDPDRADEIARLPQNRFYQITSERYNELNFTDTGVKS